jgi:hypothetical protein
MDTERIDILILARLAGPAKKPPTPESARKQLAPLVDGRWGAAEWRARFDERVAALRERGEVTPGRLSVTDAGRARVAAALGVDPVPDWRTLKRWVLPALALELAPGAPRVRERLSKADDLRGAVLRHAHALPGGNTPTQTQAVDRLAWKLLGVDTDRPLTLAEVRRHLLARLLDDSRLPLAKLVPMLVANAVDARRTSADAVREALIGRWLAHEDDDAETAPADGDGAIPAPMAEPDDQTVPIGVPHDLSVTAAPPPVALDLDGFAREVQAAADREQEGRFGARKVFIAAVWQRLRQAGSSRWTGMDLDAFKRHLVDANRADLLGLHRADLVPLMDPELVRASEIVYGNASFHFIESPFVRR